MTSPISEGVLGASAVLERIWRFCRKWMIHALIGWPLFSGIVGSGVATSQYADVYDVAINAPSFWRDGKGWRSGQGERTYFACRACTLPQYVVLTHTDMMDGPISGSVSCQDSAGRQIMSGQCLPSRQILEEAVFACGPTMVTIDQSWTHSWSVAFPVDWKPGKPSAVDVVRCVKGHVGFGFSAVIAPPPKLGEVPGADGDSKPFLPLHRR